MPQISAKPLLSSRKISKRVQELGREIAEDLGARPLTIIAVLDGAFCFVADLVRAINLPDISLRFVRAASYGSGTTSRGKVTVAGLPDCTGESVLLVDDILDTGRTLQTIKSQLSAANIYTCVLLNKPLRRVPDGLPTAEYIGFTIPDVFVVGYGLDYDGRFRHLPDVRTLSESDD